MRSFLRDHWKAIVAIILLVVLAMFTVNPGAAMPAPSLAMRLRMHVGAIAPGADDGVPVDNARQQQALQQAARYIEATLREQGYAIRHPAGANGAAKGLAPRDIEVSIANLAARAKPERIFIVGAHVGAPGGGAGPDAKRAENLRGSGTAAVLELARLLKHVHPGPGTEIRFDFFFEQAPPWPGSHIGGQSGGHMSGDVSGDVSGRDFIAFVGTLESSRRVQQALAAFQVGAGVPARGLATPAYVQGVTLSGRAAYQGAGTPAILVTDTAFGRYPYFEATNEADDDAADPPAQPAQPDYSGIARVVSGLARTIEALAVDQQG